MEEINLKELLDYFKERLTLFLVIVLTVVLAGSIYAIFLKTPMYQSSSTVLLVSKNEASNLTTSDVQLSKSLTTTYSEIIKSRRVIEQVIENLSLDYSYAELTKNVSVSSVNDTEIIRVAVNNPDRGVAADITNEIVKVFSAEIVVIYEGKVSNVSTIDKATEAKAPYNVNVAKDFLIFLLVGIVLAAAFIFIVYYFDTTIKSADEIEEKLGLPIFGVVPKVKKKGK